MNPLSGPHSDVGTKPAWEICILAGGLSRRMGRDKAGLRLGSRTLLGHVRASAAALGVPVRVVRRDAVPRCGPLGGVLTALRRTRAGAVLFLACDMPWVSSALLRLVMRRAAGSGLAAFVEDAGGVGFPFVVRREALSLVADQIARGAFSLQALARRLGARRIKLAARWQGQLRNLNTPADWQRARAELRAGRRPPPAGRNAAGAAACQGHRACLR